MRLAYPVELAEDDGGWTVSFPDVPEAITWGVDRAAALEQAEDALVTALSFYVDDGRRLPPPSAAARRPLAVVPPLEAAKLALHQAMLDRGVGPTELARRLAADPKAVRRLLDPLHRSHVGEVEKALRLLGRRLVVDVRDAA
jgi:antitoxin HicB